MKTSRTDDIRAYILTHVEDNPTGIATQTAKKFRISRPGVHRHINSLIASGQLAKIGHRAKARYARTTERQQVWVLKRSEIRSPSDAWELTCARKLRVFKSNVIDLLQWGFCQILINSLQYSTSDDVVVFFEFSGKTIRLSILDDGAGIFAKICEKNQISDQREAALLLMKGTQKQADIGQGLFWCGKLFDSLLVRANGLEFCRFGSDDWYLDNAPQEDRKGTLVQVSLDIATTKTLSAVLRPGGTSPADRNHLFVKMLKLDEALYLTKEDAQKLLFDLDGFKEIVLDFKAVRNVGHSFIDEIFNLHQVRHPEVEINFVNANSNIKFMIERSLLLSSAKQKQRE